MRNNISLGRLLKKASLALVTALMISVPLYAAIDIYEFDSPEQEAMFHQLGKELRCPKCQNNNIADSNAALAQDLRMKVYEMLKQGKSEKEIIDYMVARYGNFVTYNPPMTFSTAILWVGPFGFLIIGFAVLVIRSRRKIPLQLNRALSPTQSKSALMLCSMIKILKTTRQITDDPILDCSLNTDYCRDFGAAGSYVGWQAV